MLGWLVFIGLWWLLALWVGSEARLPSPGRVFEEIVAILQEDFWAQFWASIVRVVAGFFAAVLIGTPVGLLMGRSKYWSNFLQSPVVVAMHLVLALGKVRRSADEREFGFPTRSCAARPAFTGRTWSA